MIPPFQPRRRSLSAATAATFGLLLAAGCSTPVDEPDDGAGSVGSRPAEPRDHSPRAPRATVTAPTVDPELPLAGSVVVLDPGHQLGNAVHRSEVSAPVDAGGFTKPCNSTGTATSSGYPEATFVWQVARVARRLLVRRGARVLLTRSANSANAWGPCVDERGRAGNPGEAGPTADLKLSIHADGSLVEDAHGFHVIAPAETEPWTTDIVGPSRHLADVVRDALVAEGFVPSTYAGRDGVDVRGDLGTLNLSDVPAVLVELGNMRHPGDAALMTSPSGRRSYASALVRSVERFVGD